MTPPPDEAPRAGGLRGLVREAALIPVFLYRRLVSPWLPPACRFRPTCSTYAMQAVRRHGILRGGWLSARRILRCRPGGGAGDDPVPE